MATVSLRGVAKRFAADVDAVRDLDLEVEDGEFLVLVGPSGCGKSTTLRMIAGLEEVSAGSVLIGDRDVTDLAPGERDVAMVFQSYALYPHMTVAENMGFALKLAGRSRDEVDQRVREVADLLDLAGQLDRKPASLSGGQQQRVAMGRAIVRHPQVFLMDEPLSNLDARLRVQMRAEISTLQRRLGVTTVYVTHDQVEAMTMGDRVAVLRDGVLQQVAPPSELYTRPGNVFVATFLGAPSMNVVRGVVSVEGSRTWVTVGDDRLRVPDIVLEKYPRAREMDGRTVAVGMRPEHFVPAADAPAGGRLTGLEVDFTELLGADLLVHFHTRVSARMVARLEPNDVPGPGDHVELGFKVEHLHLFDLDSGAALR